MKGFGLLIRAHNRWLAAGFGTVVTVNRCWWHHWQWYCVAVAVYRS